MSTTLTTPRDFKTADAQLTGRNRESRKIARNTYLKRRGVSIAVQLHDTDVVTYSPDGSITLNSGGWNTVTTRDRMNTFSPFRVGTERGTAYVSSNGKRYRYFDGITFGPRGGCRNPLSEASTGKRDAAKEAKRKQIAQYVDGWIETVITGQMPNPSGGDCWDCCMFPERKGFEANHLTAHMEESYYVPSLLVKALTAKGYHNVGVAFTYICGLKPNDETGTIDGTRADVKMIRKTLTWYMRKHLGA